MVVAGRTILWFAFWVAFQASVVAAVERTFLSSHRILQVLSLDNAPFTNSSKGGIDTQILRSVAEKLNIAVRLTSINSLNYTSTEKIK